MSAYATQAQFTAMTAHLDLELPSDIGALLERASRDLDTLLGWQLPITVSLRIDPATLNAYQVAALARAAVAQAAYRLQIGEEDLVEGSSRVTGVAGLTFASQAPDRVGPEALSALAGAGLLRRSGTVYTPPPLVQ